MLDRLYFSTQLFRNGAVIREDNPGIDIFGK
jgi:hypothetical protein